MRKVLLLGSVVRLKQGCFISEREEGKKQAKKNQQKLVF
jgi:hypothetical protein